VPENSVKTSLTYCVLQMGVQYTDGRDAPNVWIIFVVWKYVLSYYYCEFDVQVTVHHDKFL